MKYVPESTATFTFLRPATTNSRLKTALSVENRSLRAGLTHYRKEISTLRSPFQTRPAKRFPAQVVPGQNCSRSLAQRWCWAQGWCFSERRKEWSENRISEPERAGRAPALYVREWRTGRSFKLEGGSVFIFRRQMRRPNFTGVLQKGQKNSSLYLKQISKWASYTGNIRYIVYFCMASCYILIVVRCSWIEIRLCYGTVALVVARYI